MFGVPRSLWIAFGGLVVAFFIVVSFEERDSDTRIASQRDDIIRLRAENDRLNREINRLNRELALSGKQDKPEAQQKARETKPQRPAARPFSSKSSVSSSVRASGKLTQTGTGASSGLFYIVLDNRVQCFFSYAGLSAGLAQMKRFQRSSATTLIVSGTDKGTMPMSGQRRLDNCRIIDWR